MAKPTSSTNIVNLSLRLLKIDPVTSISPPDSNSKAAASGAAWYDQARRETLEAHPWNFASKRVEIASEADAPLFEYTTKYQLPADFIRLNRIGEDWDFAELEYEIEQDYILCDVATPLPLVYVYDFTDVSKMSPKFITSLSFKLASLMGYEMTGSTTIVSVMEQQFATSISMAASVDGQNRPMRSIQRSRLTEARQNIGTNKGWRSWGDS